MPEANCRTRLRDWTPAIGALALVGTLVACSGSANGAGNQPGTGGATSTPAAPATGGSGGGRGPGAFGTIAAITGKTMQVQNQQTGQIAVTWTATTTFTHTVTASLSAIKTGSCVTAIGGSGTSSDTTSFTATTLLVSRAQKGSCTGGLTRPGGQGGGFPGGGTPPSGFPTGGFPSGAVPSGFPSGGFPGQSGQPGAARVGAIASGKVTGVSGSTLTIASVQFGSSQATTKTVTVDSKTKITTQGATTSKSLAVGKCVSAQGNADSSGAVTASRVQISDPTNGQCTAGLGLFGGGGGG